MLKNFKVIFAILCMLFICTCVSITASAKIVTVYSPAGEAINIDDSFVEMYTTYGWSLLPFPEKVTIYSKNGDIINVLESEVATYKQWGWSENIDDVRTTIYSEKGLAQVFNNEVNTYLGLGWSLTPVTTSLPVTFLRNSAYSSGTLDLKSFDITYCEYMESIDRIRLHYDIDYDISGSISLKMKCYNSQGTLIETNPLSLYHDFFDVHSSTATISIACEEEHGAITSGEFFYGKQVTLYALDGRTVTVYDIQTPIYTRVGWYEPVTMYALDGREIEVPPYEVEAYKAVGWYTAEGYLYQLISEICNTYISSGEYESAIQTIEEDEYLLEGTEYEYPLQLLKEDAMNKWRSSISCPLGYIAYSTGEDYSVPTATIAFRNISYKKIVAFKVKFTCYNIFNEVEDTFYSGYYSDNADLESGEAASYTWDLYGADSVYSLANIRVTEVIFADGTKW